VGFTPSLVSGVWVGLDTPAPILPGNAYAADVAVPLWAGFMKSATANAKAEWIPTPKNIVSVSVCRLSGKRPASGCDSAHVTLPDGSTTERSMISSEYFVRGTEPTDTCHLHVGRSLLAKMGDWFRDAPSAERNSAIDAAPAASAPVVEERAEAAEETKAAPEEPKKKRGFWSRVFGRGDKDEDKKKDEQKKPKP
jgi:membrane carboxypeptidase/penicillin-binding protein